MRRSLLILAATIGTPGGPAADDTPALKKGEKIVFLATRSPPGASPQGVRHVVRRRWPRSTRTWIEVIGAGISGNKVPDLQSGWRRTCREEADPGRHLHRDHDVWHGENDPAKGRPRTS